jgi:hypothetical protein
MQVNFADGYTMVIDIDCDEYIHTRGDAVSIFIFDKRKCTARPHVFVRQYSLFLPILTLSNTIYDRHPSHIHTLRMVYISGMADYNNAPVIILALFAYQLP